MWTPSSWQLTDGLMKPTAANDLLENLKRGHTKLCELSERENKRNRLHINVKF